MNETDYDSGNWFKDTYFKVRDTVRNWLQGFQFDPGWERGAVIAVGILVVLTAGYYGYNAQSGLGLWVDLLVPMVAVALGYLLFLFIGIFLLRLLLKLPLAFWVAVGLGVLAGNQVWGDRTWLHWVFNIGLVLAAVFIGVGLRGRREDEWYYSTGQKKALIVTQIVIGAAAIVAVGVLLFLPGREAPALPVQVQLSVPKIASQDPSMPGSLKVSTLTYGSGTDQRRVEFGEEVNLQTDQVDASRFVSYDGLEEKARAFYWGFGVDELPLNGRVWYPEGDGPFPLVLIVHGNHNQVDFSDPGYGYLGFLLASRGMIVVSVDENFLNGGLWGDASGENDARAWLLLKHLEIWDEWNSSLENQFYQKVDLDRVALIGHSRGGEAAALAATFSKISRFPNNARITWDYDFNIRSVVAIAPVDEQWKPAGHSNPLENVNYLVLQGSHDADLYYFDGIQQYNRVEFTDPRSEYFKAAVYIYRANHGQFNTTWGARDSTGVKGLFLNRKSLLTADEQQQIAKVYISAFLEVTLKGQDTYKAIFEEYRKAGNWLPQTGYINQYEDYGYQLAADYEEDVDLTTCSLPRCRITMSGLSRWREEAIQFRNEDRQDNHVVRVGWSSNEAFYAIGIGQVDWEFTKDTVLVFKAADAREPLNLEEGLDFSVVLVDRFGNQASVRLGDVLPLLTQFPAEISRLPQWNESYFKETSEEVFQSYRLPLEIFADENPDLDLEFIREIRFEFDQTTSGLLYLDEIGFDLVP